MMSQGRGMCVYKCREKPLTEVELSHAAGEAQANLPLGAKLTSGYFSSWSCKNNFFPLGNLDVKAYFGPLEFFVCLLYLLGSGCFVLLLCSGSSSPCLCWAELQ